MVNIVGGNGANLETLFHGRRYRLDFFQRDYVWTEAEIDRLLRDLETCFRDSWESSHSRTRVAQYEPYFLGPFVSHHTDQETFITDGQQRFVTLLILLMYVRRLLVEQGDMPTATRIDGLVAKHEYGRPKFLLNVEEYERCFELRDPPA